MSTKVNQQLHIDADIEGEKQWKVGFTEDLNNKVLKVDTVDGIAPTDLEDLYFKLEALLA